MVIGGTWPGDGIVLGQVARRYPTVAFVAATSGPQRGHAAAAEPERVPRPPGFAQEAAGLGFYANRRLGWRRAAVLVEDDEEGWEESAAFTAEFCAVGGRIVRSWRSRSAYAAAARESGASRRRRRRLLRRRHGSGRAVAPAPRGRSAPRRLIVGLGISSDPRAGRFLPGVVSR